jgi:putative ABC transport system permease protein
MVLILIAAILVIVPAYYTITGWLDNFAYQVRLNYMLFIAVSILALVFAFFTVAFHALKTARINPVDSLKYE